MKSLQSVRFDPKYVPAVKDIVRQYLIPQHLKRIGIQSKEEITEEIMELEPMLDPNVLHHQELQKTSLLYVEKEENENKEDSPTAVVGCSLGFYQSQEENDAYIDSIKNNPKFKETTFSKPVREFIDKSLEFDSFDIYREYKIKKLVIYEAGVIIPRLRGRGLNILQMNEFAEKFGVGHADAMLFTSLIPPEIHKADNFTFHHRQYIENCREEITCQEIIYNGFLINSKLAFF